MFITILLLLIFIILIYNYYVHYGKNGRIINLIPGPSSYPIVGNLLQFLGSVEDIWNVTISFSNQYYSIWKFWLSFIPIVMIRHPDDLKIILSSRKHIEKSSIYDLAKPWLGTGLGISKSDKWHSRRKLLTPAFHFNILEQFVEILIKEGENMTQSLKYTEDTVVNDLISFCSEYTLNAIYETAMGFSLQDLNAFQSQQYRKLAHEISELLVYRLFRPWLRFDWIFSWTSKGRQQAEMVKILHEFIEQIIAERKLYHEHTNGQYLKNFDSDISAEKDDTETTGTRRKKLAMLDLLIAASREGLMNDSDIREEVNVFVFAGYDTVATAVSYILMLLAEHKDIQDRVRTEIDTVMQVNEKFTMKSLQQLSYLDRCIKEALRLYPSSPFISRVCAEDVKLQSYLIPAKTAMVINIHGVHRDPNFWLNPEKFDPDRFLPEKIQNRHPYSYIPFSAGPRNCIGQKFAMLEMKAMISSLLHNFYLEPIDYLNNVRLQYNVMLHPVHPFRIRFVPICKTKSASI